jgi:hypothetical protein
MLGHLAHHFWPGHTVTRTCACAWLAQIAGNSLNSMALVWHKRPQIWNGSWPFSSGLRGCRRTYHTILKLADHALSKMVRYVLMWPLRPELDGQDPFQICGRLCRTRKTPTLATFLKVFNSVVLDDPRKTVYKKVNKGWQETDPSQVYFGWNGGKIQIWFVANFFTQEILFWFCLTSFKSRISVPSVE